MSARATLLLDIMLVVLLGIPEALCRFDVNLRTSFLADTRCLCRVTMPSRNHDSYPCTHGCNAQRIKPAHTDGATDGATAAPALLAEWWSSRLLICTAPSSRPREANRQNRRGTRRGGHGVETGDGVGAHCVSVSGRRRDAGRCGCPLTTLARHKHLDEKTPLKCPRM